MIYFTFKYLPPTKIVNILSWQINILKFFELKQSRFIAPNAMVENRNSRKTFRLYPLKFQLWQVLIDISVESAYIK